MTPHTSSGVGLSFLRRCAPLALVAAALLIGGCASGLRAHKDDPLEPLNRTVMGFNETVDSLFLKPAATIYQGITPSPVRTGIRNIFSNLGDAWSTVNNVLQLRPREALESGLRFGVNTLMGFYGVLDIASEMNIERHREDFGQTLGRWGVPTGPYLVLPFTGPSTLRDTLASGVDVSGNYISHLNSAGARSTAYALQGLELRANLLRAGDVLDEASIDKYAFTRDAFLQRRRSQVFDGLDRAEDPPDDDAYLSEPPPASAPVGKAPGAQ
jgi:phospholipid-binding lipoprotein MlaA